MSRKSRVRFLILVLFMLLAEAAVTTIPAYAATWTATPQQLTNDSNLDHFPSILQLQDGRVLLVWQSFKTTTQLFSLIYSPITGWGPQSQLTNNPGGDVGPGLAQLANGTIMIAWASNRTNNVDIYLARTDGASLITGETRITTSPDDDSLPSIVAARNGSIWIFWTRFSLTLGRDDIYYKVVTNGVQGPEVLLTPSGGLNMHPHATQTKEGKIWLTYQKQVGGSGSFNNEIFTRYFDGVNWTSENQLTNNSASDEDPAIIQDRAGNLWIFWSREFAYGGQQFQDELMYVESTNGGATWIVPSGCPSVINDNPPVCRLTNDPSGGEKDDREPSLAQSSSDKNLWVVYSSDPTDQWDIYLLKWGPIPAEDLGIPYTTVSSYKLIRGGTVNINVKVQNYGDSTQTTTLQIFATNTSSIRLVSKSLTIPGGQYTIYSYSWTTTVVPAKYALSATITAAVGESSLNMGDNSFQAGRVYVTIPGDLNGDGRVNLLDAVALGQAYHSRGATANWNAKADINGDGVVNLLDAAALARAYHSRPGMANWNQAADINGDGYVDINDAAILGALYLSSKGSPNWNPNADITGNGYVDIFDAAILGAWYGTVS